MVKKIGWNEKECEQDGDQGCVDAKRKWIFLRNVWLVLQNWDGIKDIHNLIRLSIFSFSTYTLTKPHHYKKFEQCIDHHRREISK